MILLGTFFFGIIVGYFIERNRVRVTSWGPNGRSCGIPSSHHSSRMGRYSRRSRSHDWRLRPSSSGVSVDHLTVPFTSLPCSSRPSSHHVSSLPRPRRPKRLEKMMGFGRPHSRVTWDSDITDRYFGLGRRRYRHIRPSYSSTFPPSTSSIFYPNIQPSTGVQVPIQITNQASNLTPVATRVKVRGEGSKGKKGKKRKGKRTKAKMMRG